MARGESDGESSVSGRESSSSGEESEPKGKISEYEKQRFSRIAENKARLDALGISKAAKALVAPSPISKKRRVKRNSGEEDDDYTPANADDDDEDDDDDDDDDEEFLGNSTCKRKNKASASKRKVLSKKIVNTSDDEYDDLDKAIALSLQDSVAGGSRTTPTKTMRNDKEAATLKKKTPDLMSKMQMTQDELVIYFCLFDEAGKGFTTLRDVAKMATVHDFTWTQEELQDMIRCFDMDKDGKLSLDEFRKIVSRCRMLKES